MKAIHRVGRKVIASFVLVLFASLQVLPQGFADSVPLAQEIQNQLPTTSVDPTVSSEPAQVPETSIDFLVGSESPLSPPEPVVGPIVLPPVPWDILPVSVPVPEERPLGVPVEQPIDPELLKGDWMDKPEGDPISIPPPQTELELTPAPEPLEPDPPSSGGAVLHFEERIQVETKEPETSSQESLLRPMGFFSRIIGIIGRLIATIQAKRSLVDRFNLSDEEKDEVLKDIKVVSVEKKSWPTPCSIWGAPPPNIVCIQMVVNGYQVVLELYGNTYEFRAGELDPAKEAAISAINHLMEHGTPRHPFSPPKDGSAFILAERHVLYPKLSQIRIGDIATRKYFREDGVVSEVFFDIDLKVQLNRRRSVSWRYTVDARTNEVVGRKLYSPFRPHHLTYLIDDDQGKSFRPKFFGLKRI